MLWPAARLLCEYFVANDKSIFENKTCIELGAGVGLCGLFLPLFVPKVKNVVLTDGNDVVMEILDANVSKLKAAHPSVTASSFKLNWTSAEDIEKLKKAYPNGFDVLFGSDIIFWPNALPGLVKVVNTFLSNDPNSCFILAFQSRALETERWLLKMMEESNLRYEKLELPPKLMLGKRSEKNETEVGTQTTENNQQKQGEENKKEEKQGSNNNDIPERNDDLQIYKFFRRK